MPPAAQREEPMPEQWEAKLQKGGAVIPAPAMEPVENASLADRLREVLESHPDSTIRVRVNRTKPDKKLAWLDDFAPDEFLNGEDLRIIRDRWGGGTYDIRLLGLPSGGFRYVVNIAGDPKEPTQETTAAASAPQQTIPSGIEQLIAGMAESNAALLKAVTAKPDIGETILKYMPLLALAKEAIAPLLERALKPPPSAPATPPGDPVEQLTRMVELMRGFKSAAKEINDEAPDADPLMSLVKDAMPTVLQALQQQRAPMQGQPIQPIQMPQEMAPPIAAPVEQPTESAQPSAAQMMLYGTLDAILQKADAKETPESAADFILRSLPDEMIDQLLRMANLPNWVEMLASMAPTYAPRLQTHRDWLHAVAKVAQKLDEEDRAQNP